MWYQLLYGGGFEELKEAEGDHDYEDGLEKAYRGHSYRLGLRVLYQFVL